MSHWTAIQPLRYIHTYIHTHVDTYDYVCTLHTYMQTTTRVAHESHVGWCSTSVMALVHLSLVALTCATTLCLTLSYDDLKVAVCYECLLQKFCLNWNSGSGIR